MDVKPMNKWQEQSGCCGTPVADRRREKLYDQGSTIRISNFLRSNITYDTHVQGALHKGYLFKNYRYRQNMLV